MIIKKFMEKNILAVYGSPRTGSNTSTLMASFIAGVEENPAGGSLKVHRLRINSLDISPCRGCRSCSLTGQCVIQDDMQKVYGLLEKADFIAVASPIFFTSVPAGLKALIDRCQKYWSLKYELRQKVVESQRQGIFLSCAGSGSGKIFDCARKVIRSFFDVLDINYHSDYVYLKVDEKGDINKHPHALKQVYDWGRSEQFYNLLKVGE